MAPGCIEPLVRARNRSSKPNHPATYETMALPPSTTAEQHSLREDGWPLTRRAWQSTRDGRAHGPARVCHEDVQRLPRPHFAVRISVAVDDELHATSAHVPTRSAVRVLEVLPDHRGTLRRVGSHSEGVGTGKRLPPRV